MKIKLQWHIFIRSLIIPHLKKQSWWMWNFIFCYGLWLCALVVMCWLWIIRCYLVNMFSKLWTLEGRFLTNWLRGGANIFGAIQRRQIYKNNISFWQAHLSGNHFYFKIFYILWFFLNNNPITLGKSWNSIDNY